MKRFPIFLSLVIIARNRGDALEGLLREVATMIAPLVADHEIVVVDNASSDDSVARLEALTSAEGLANLQVFALTGEVDVDTAAQVGLDHALGDWVAILDPALDAPAFLPAMLERAMAGADIVYAANRARPRGGAAYRVAAWCFNRLYRWLNGVDLAQDVPGFRMLSRRVVGFLLQHPRPAAVYRHLPALRGFARANLEYDRAPPFRRTVRLADAFERGMRLLVSTTRAPLRIVTSLSLFGAGANVLYSAYVIGIALLKADVAPGWTTLSLQQSGMFLLISLVLLVLGEYLLSVTALASEGPAYHVAREFASVRMTRQERLNLAQPAADPEAGSARTGTTAGATDVAAQR